MQRRALLLPLSAFLIATLVVGCTSVSKGASSGLAGLAGVAPLLPSPAVQHARIPSDLKALSEPLVFVSDRGPNYEIFAMLPDGSGQHALTKTAEQNTWPALSPDGTRVAFARTIKSNTDVYVMNVNGTGLRRLTFAPAPDYHPTWSPDGRQIAYEGMEGGQADIHVMNANGSHDVNITHNPALDGSPAWSPDGNEIVFESSRQGQDELYSILPNGTGLHRLTHSKGENTDPAWSPDGRTIAFSSTRDGPPRLFVMDADGATEIMVSPPASGLGPGVAPGVWADSNPAWSPNGAWLAFQTTRSGVPQVWAMHPDGEPAVPLTVLGSNGSPSWGG
jgi:Tol biopolymer transport system component